MKFMIGSALGEREGCSVCTRKDGERVEDRKYLEETQDPREMHHVAAVGKVALLLNSMGIVSSVSKVSHIS